MTALAQIQSAMVAYPGRAAIAARTVISVSLVTIAVLWLELPALDIAAYIALFACSRSAAATVRLGMTYAIATPIAVAIAIVLWGATTDFPAMRVTAMAAITFFAMYVRGLPSKAMALAGGIGVMTVCLLVIGSTVPSGDLLARTMLKAAFAVSIAGLTAAACARLVFPTEEPSEAKAPPPPVPSARDRGLFALRATVATMLGFFTYKLVDWNGIHTCMFTTLFIASSDFSATVLKGRLRLAGAVVGSLAALAAIVFIVPGLTTIAGLLTIVAPVTFIAAWIAIGPQRFAYLGMQVGLAFYLALLGGSGPTTNIHEPRDRIVGVLLGVILVTLCMDGYRQGKAQAD
jgi:hypothetical protein